MVLVVLSPALSVKYTGGTNTTFPRTRLHPTTDLSTPPSSLNMEAFENHYTYRVHNANGKVKTAKVPSSRFSSKTSPTLHKVRRLIFA